MADGGATRSGAVRRALLALSLLGTALFGSAWAVSYFNPILLERAAREIIRLEVQHRVGEKLDDLSTSRTVVLAHKALGKTDAEIAAVRKDLEAKLPQKIADVIADMAKVDCECRKRMRESAKQAKEQELSSLSHLRERLAHFVESAYAGVARKLLREARIFTGANAAVFALLGWVTHRRQAAVLQLALPAVVLMGAAAITAYLYLFQQDWLHTILFNQYVGLAYGGYLLLAVALLSDVVFNRARVCTRAVNMALDAAGSATVVLPC